MRVLVTGGRNYNDWRRVHAILDAHHASTPITAIIHGGATGADSWAGRWASYNRIKEIAVPADWKKYKNYAGPIRNQKMINEQSPDLVIAFPGGAGTANCVRRAKAAGLVVMEIEE